MSISRSNIVIISTQTPIKNKQGYAPGKTSLTIQEFTKAGLIPIHENKKLRDNEKDIFANHLTGRGWVIITGHGKFGTDSLSGDYVRDSYKTEITCSAKEYVALVLQANVLKKNDKLHILLYACRGAAGNKDDSFAGQLVQEFAKYEIFTEIIATESTVGRIRNKNDIKDFWDVKGEQIRFRTERENLYSFCGGPEQKIEKTKLDKNIFITKKGISFSANLRKSIESFLQSKLPKNSSEISWFDLIQHVAYLLTEVRQESFERPGRTKMLDKCLAQLAPIHLVKFLSVLTGLSMKDFSWAFPHSDLRKLGINKEIIIDRIAFLYDYIEKVYEERREKNIVDFVNYKRALKFFLINNFSQKIPKEKFDEKAQVKVAQIKITGEILNSIEEIKQNLESYSSLDAIRQKLEKHLQSLIENDKLLSSQSFFKKSIKQKLIPFMPINTERARPD